MTPLELFRAVADLAHTAKANSAKLDRILLALGVLQTEVSVMAVDLSTLESAVQANTDAEQSAILLLTQLSDLIKQSAADPVKVAELADRLKASAAALAAAVTANTPANP